MLGNRVIVGLDSSWNSSPSFSLTSDSVTFIHKNAKKGPECHYNANGNTVNTRIDLCHSVAVLSLSGMKSFVSAWQALAQRDFSMRLAV